MKTVAIDCETHLFRPGRMAPKIVSVAWATDDAAQVLIAGEAEEWLQGTFRQVMEGHLQLVGHAVSYDLACIAETFPRLSGYVWAMLDAHAAHCTCLREKLRDGAAGTRKGTSRESYTLTACAERKLDVKLDKDDEIRLNFHELDGVDLKYWPEQFYRYALLDAVVALKLFRDQAAWAKKEYPGFEAESARQTAFDFALRMTSVRGLLVDHAQVQAVKTQLEPEMAAALKTIQKFGLTHGWNSEQKDRKALQKIVEQSFPGGTPPRTKASEKFPNGQIITAEDVVLRCNHPAIEAWLTFSGHQKTISTYLEPLEAAGDLPVHASYDCLGSEASRTSCYNPNLQNLPRKAGVRECLIARPGFVFASADYDAQEMRTLAQALLLLCGKSQLADRFNADPDFDPHADFAARTLGIKYEEGLERKKSGDKEFLDRRQMCKPANFGLPTGMSPETFVAYCRGSYGITITSGESENLCKAWKKQWPEMGGYFRHCQEVVRTGGKFVGLNSGYIRGGCSFTQIANGYFQHLAANASKNGLYLVAKRCFDDETSALYGCRPVFFVHDEMGIEAPKEYAPEAAEALVDALCEGMQEVCPDVPARASALLMWRWSKKAKAVFGDDGRLKPWGEK